MRARWEAIRTSLIFSVTTLQAEREFKTVRGTEPVLERFDSPSHLVDYLTNRTGDRDEKDAIYRILVWGVQTGVTWSELGMSLLWLGLWPALDATYRRRLKHFIDEPEALASAIGVQFSSAVGRADLSRINRLAATLGMNTERDLVEALRREWTERNGRAELPPDDDLKAEGKSTLDFLVEAEERRAMWARIREAVGDDAELLMAVLVDGLSQREAAARLGISHDAARKRFQRAAGRVKKAFGKVVPFGPRKVRLEGGDEIPEHGGKARG